MSDRFMEYLLYKLEQLAQGDAARTRPKLTGQLTAFSPFSVRWMLPALRAGGIEYLKTVAMTAWSVLARCATASQCRVYAYVGSDGRILHYSVVSPTTMHLPWLGEDQAGTEIGGCLTIPDARGKRIYPYVLHQIARSAEHAKPIYMIVESGNEASRAGMTRAGFEQVHKLHRKRGTVRPPQYENCAGD